MGLILFKWLFVAILSAGADKPVHPIYVSVTEIEHNAKEKTLEISAKVFTNDFEQTLRTGGKQRIDLLDIKQKAAMGIIINDYLQKHLKISVAGKPVTIKFLGYEQQEEGIVCFFQADNISNVKELTVTDTILYEYKDEQMSILHVTVNNTRKSTKLLNPESSATFSF